MPDEFDHFYFVPSEKVEVVYTVEELIQLSNKNKLSDNSREKLISVVRAHVVELDRLRLALGEDLIPF